MKMRRLCLAVCGALLGAVLLSIAGAQGVGGGGIQRGSGSGGGIPTTGVSFTVSWGSGGAQACSATADQTWKYYLSGPFVILVPTGELTCTASNTNFISAPNAIPAAIRPNISAVIFLGMVRTQDNAVETPGCLWIETDFSMTIRKTQANGLCNNVGVGTWTNSGTRTLYMTTNIGANNFMYVTTRN